MEDTYFEFFPKQEESINKSLRVTEKDMQDMLEITKKWFLQEPHLPIIPENSILQDTFDKRFKFFLRVNKLSIEKTKKKLDFYYSSLDLYPDFFKDREPLKPRMVEAMDTFTFLPLPKPLDANTRVVFYQLNDPDPEKFKMESFIALACNVLDMKSNFDLCYEDIYILDFHNYTLGHVTRLPLPVVAKMYTIVVNAFTDKINGIHFINVPPIAHTIVMLVKMVLNEKMASRIYLHNDMESLFKIIPRKIIPSDFGGDEKPLTKLREEWRLYVESKNDWFIENCKMKADQTLRIEKLDLQDDMFGSDGSFRTLTID